MASHRWLSLLPGLPLGRGRHCPRTSSAKSAVVSLATQSCSPAAGVLRATRVPAMPSSCSSDVLCQNARNLKRRTLSSRFRRFALRRMKSVAAAQPHQRCRRPPITQQCRRTRHRTLCSSLARHQRLRRYPCPWRRRLAARAGSMTTWISQPRPTPAERLVAAVRLLLDSSRRSRRRRRHQPAFTPVFLLPRLPLGPPTPVSPRALANVRRAF